jgi:triosephosphate isomerase
MAKDAGAAVVLVGHSERRHVFGETDAQCAKKCLAASRAGLPFMLCVGETIQQREARDTERVVIHQLREGLSQVPNLISADFKLAYEPVWAIGTGLTPTPSDVAEVHGFIRERLAVRFGAIGQGVRILYGGSVKPSNAAELMTVANVDGALVGGASLKADDFLGIARAYG